MVGYRAKSALLVQNFYIFRNNTTSKNAANYLYFCNMFRPVTGHHHIRLQYTEKGKLYQDGASPLHKLGSKMVIL
jgi:hypothetical protein